MCDLSSLNKFSVFSTRVHQAFRMYQKTFEKGYNKTYQEIYMAQILPEKNVIISNFFLRGNISRKRGSLVGIIRDRGGRQLWSFPACFTKLPFYHLMPSTLDGLIKVSQSVDVKSKFSFFSKCGFSSVW